MRDASRNRQILIGTFVVVSVLAGVVLAEAAKGELRIGITTDVATFDAQVARDAVTAKVLNNVFDTLVMITPGSTNLEPGLATVWRPNPRFTEWTFVIRPNVVFSDGTPATPELIAESLRNVPSVSERGTISADPSGKVVVQLKSPDAEFPSLIAQNYAGIVLRKKGAKEVLGSGPYVVAAESTKQRVVLVRNPKYWGPAPKVERLVFQALKGPEGPGKALLAALVADKIDLTDGIPLGELPSLSKYGHIQSSSVAGRSVGMFAMNTEAGPLKDVRVRKAIAHAINRDAIVQAFYPKGTGVAQAPIPPTIHRGQPDPYNYNPIRAKELLAEAGHAKGFKATILQTWAPRPYAVDPAGIVAKIKADLAAVGIETTVQVPAGSKEFFDRLGAGKFELSLIGWIADTGSAADFLESNLSSAMIGGCNACNNMTRIRSPKLDQLIRDARATKNRKLIDDAIAIFDSEIPFVPLVYGPEVAAWNRRVVGFKVSPTATMFLRDVSISE